MTPGTDNAYWAELDVRRSGDQREALLVRQFRAFYAELARLKRQVRAGTYSPTNGAADEEGSTAADIQRRLVSMFEDQEQTVRRQGGESLRRRYDLVQYAMVALADEVFLNVDWEGRDDWYNHLLESRQFDSQNAGVQVFEIIDRLVGQRSGETDVTTVYLYVLTLGFEGQYRDEPDTAPLDDYRERLFRYIRRHRGDRLAADRELAPSAYRHTLAQGEVQLLPNLRWWVGSLVGVGALYLLMSTALWWWYTNDLTELAQQILATP